MAVECPECGETFYAKPSYIRNGAGKHCSRECAGKARSRTLSGEGHWNWSTGRVVTRQGYIRVWVPSDHRFASMRPKNQGGVLEHRLVMAETLGRPLTNRETVHHINGDRSDNRLENLQLRRSQHGQGQRYVCADCGSENIHEVPV